MEVVRITDGNRSDIILALSTIKYIIFGKSSAVAQIRRRESLNFRVSGKIPKFIINLPWIKCWFENNLFYMDDHSYTIAQ